MRAEGLSKKTVLEKLREIKQQDLNYSDGRILCSMCTKPHPIAKLAQDLFFESNLGDPGLFPGTSKLEKEAVASLASLLNGKKAVGFIVSGGTEANFLALLAARNMSNVSNPEVVVPTSAHFSFKKICGWLRLRLVEAELDSSFKVLPGSVEKLVNENTVAIVGTAGTAELGVVDPVAELAKIALKRGVFLHVDAAFGGLVLPFLKEKGVSVPDFDFSLKGVRSITVDPHKMGLSTVPAGGLLLRDASYLEYIKTQTPYLTNGVQFTFLGTRSGASAAAAWAVFEFLGREGFSEIASSCMENTYLLESKLEELGFEVLLRPILNIVAFRSANSKVLAGKLREYGWFVSYVPRLDCIRVVLMPHTTKLHVQALVKCLAELTK